MAHNKDFIPGPDADFDGWLNNLTVYVGSKTAGGGWAHIPADKVAALQSYNAQWRDARSKTVGPHTSVDTEVKNEARKAAVGFVRPFIQQYLKFDPVTDEDRTAMNLHNRGKTHSVIGKPADRALITNLKALGGFRVEIRFQDEATPDSRAIPYGCNGALMNYTWGAEKITDYARLSQTCLMTVSPFVITLPPEGEGAFFSAAARWQNNRGELGPWSEIMHVAVS
ncbi:MAG: hypothetical protein LBG73_00115 [Spirochaetaceae bacterium]|jgi:hypothetical protein|nr:hypothetical protein [Spirochaetaceae bacterium]